MKKPDITKGEWEVEDQVYVVEMDNGYDICAMFNDTDDPLSMVHALANVQAISAVPEMIDALIEAEKQLLEYFHEEHLAENNEAYQKIKQALIKAGCTE